MVKKQNEVNIKRKIKRNLIVFISYCSIMSFCPFIVNINYYYITLKKLKIDTCKQRKFQLTKRGNFSAIIFRGAERITKQ